MGRRKVADADYQLFDVTYQDGSVTSNRKVPSGELSGPDLERTARGLIEAQDRKIAELSGRSRGPIKSIVRSRNR